MVKTFSAELRDLAEVAGVARQWRDVGGRDQSVSDDALAAILAALGHETSSARHIKASVAHLAARARHIPPMLVTEVGLATPIDTQAASAALTGEDGVTRKINIDGGMLAPVSEPGYYDLSLDHQLLKLAVAPRHCPLPGVCGKRMWGTSVQIPALRDTTSRAFGGFGALAAAAQTLGRTGCDAVAINPVHALFPGVGDDYSPYSPSSRLFLNTAMGDPDLLDLPSFPKCEAKTLIDWPTALPRRLVELRHTYAKLTVERRAQIFQASLAEGPALRRHAVFDALDCHFRLHGARAWQDWPASYHDPNGSAVSLFSSDHADEINFHLFTQWLAREGLTRAQHQSREAGMAIGLIADLAVGVHPGGSDTWAMPNAMLKGLTIGAPPDPLGPHGQNWSITGFSPDGLRESGYQPWIAMLRSALRSAGGLRIDHAFGLARLWVIPEGETSSHGSYLDYPFLDLVRLVTLEAHRASALIIAEDLGTSPAGFTHAVSERHMLGMRVLWFERAADDGFIGAHDYPSNSVAMTGTHDTPTVAGWWTGRDLDWAERLGRLPEGIDRTQSEDIREWDRGLLWSTIGDGGDRPAPNDPAPVVEAALAHVARSPALLSIVPIEDLLCEEEQPNLPGTTSEHPNWRRRLRAPLPELLVDPAVERRLGAISSRN
jgi:4-alpha-glucanotransferase